MRSVGAKKNTKINDNVKTVTYCHLCEAIKLVLLRAFFRAFILLKVLMKTDKTLWFCNELTKLHTFLWKVDYAKMNLCAMEMRRG